MGFLVMWITTIIVSAVLEKAQDFIIYKDVADEGYLINKSNIKKSVDVETYENVANINKLSLLIPILNIMMAGKHAIDYINARPVLIDRLSAAGVLEKMTKEELKEYQENPTPLNAYKINVKSKLIEINSQSILMKNDKGEAIVFYSMDGIAQNIKILKIKGPDNIFTEKEIKDTIIECWQKIFTKGIEKYGDVTDFIAAMNDAEEKDEPFSKVTEGKSQNTLTQEEKDELDLELTDYFNSLYAQNQTESEEIETHNKVRSRKTSRKTSSKK